MGFSLNIVSLLSIDSKFHFILPLGCINQDQFRAVGENVARVKADLMKEQLATFRSQLEDFARKHKVGN